MENPDSIALSDIIHESVTILLRNMEAFPAFDPSRPYEEKNLYIVDLVRIGEERLLNQLGPSVAEMYFTELKDVVLNYEQANHKTFNKGMIYADLGVSQIIIGKLDAGVAHLLAADEEDRPFIHDLHGILNSPLWHQFERPIIFGYLITFNQDQRASLDFQIDEAFLEAFLTTIELQDRLFFEVTIWALCDNLSLNEMIPNTYTRGRLYSGIKDLCLLTESLLRKHQIAIGLIAANNQIMLGELLSNALNNQNINYSQRNFATVANNLQEFVNNLENILNDDRNPEIRRICCLHLIRNFTGHHFDLNDNTVTANGRSFFDMYKASLVNVVSAILYLSHIGEI